MKKLLIILLASMLLLAGCMSASAPAASSPATDKGRLTVEFIDVGQGDSILITTPEGAHMLIDCGENREYEAVQSALASVSKIDWLVVTHPHTDHMGGMYKVIENNDIGEVYMPADTANTSAYEKMLGAIDKKGLKVHKAVAGGEIELSPEVKAEILAPTKGKHDDINNSSVVIRLTYGTTAFMLTGDAEKASEEEILKTGAELSADVLKLGHHGSSSSTGEDFLRAVSPSAAIVSCGAGNDYGHPHKETVALMKKYDIPLYRTDELGSIVCVSDGSIVTVGDVAAIGGNKAPASKSPAAEAAAQSGEPVIGNKNSKIYHTKSCGSLPAEANRVTFGSAAEAEKAGYEPHSKCIK